MGRDGDIDLVDDVALVSDVNSKSRNTLSWINGI